MEVDWERLTAIIVDRDSGEKVKAYIFIAMLPYSQISYAEVIWDRIIHDSYQILIDGEISMRERHRLESESL